MNRWKQLVNVHVMVLLVWIAAFAVHVMQPVTDPDTPWQIASGLYMLNHHTIPTTDPFSWSMKGHPWVTQEWLFEVVLAFMVKHFQFSGAWLFLVAVHTATVLVLYRLAVRISGNPVVASLTAVAGTLPAIIFWIFRPQIISYLMFAVFLWILQMVREGKFRALWLVPVLMLIWANSHASSTIGILMLLLEFLLSFIPSIGRFQGLHLPRGARLRLLAAAVGGLLVGFANPNGVKAYTYALLSTNPLMTNNIMEWHSPDFHTQYFKYGVLGFLAVVFLLLLGSKRNIPLRETLYFGGSFAVMLIYQRFVPYVAIASVPLTAYLIANWARGLNRPFNWMLIFNSVVMAAVLVYTGTRLPSVRGPMNAHWNQGSYPIAAVNYLEKNHLLKKRLLNSYAWGGYLIYRGIPPFIDGRTDIYLHGSIFSDYLNMQNMGWNAPDLIDSYGFQEILIPPNYALTTYLNRDKNWRLIYSDNTADVFVRVHPPSTSG
ncbi:hypothetical protein LLE49_21140 [Alicyclobacillus tolerans]|uniref:hypothetical protein n=1 Tax=Alicyclobacillus tolerans TaxID=90970 RepID=UPI001F33B882|nr:hypothetical protein [Alicyclobacillus tolerans]MCF8567230.1 hypothetical protein [Alicyclobacillus tolerans]